MKERREERNRILLVYRALLVFFGGIMEQQASKERAFVARCTSGVQQGRGVGVKGEHVRLVETCRTLGRKTRLPSPPRLHIGPEMRDCR